ncbi:MAG: M28 family peptidase [Planctomycetota bacterium]
MRHLRQDGIAWVLVWMLAAAGPGSPARGAEANARGVLIETFKEHVGWLAAPEREGRGPGTEGLEVAAEWVTGRFAEIGLRPPAGRETKLQPFEMTLEAKLGPATENTAELVGPPDAAGGQRVVPLELGKDFTPLAIGGSGAFDLPLVFAGYGITAPSEKYDDYAPLADDGGVRDKAVIVLRQEPQKNDPHGAFEGNLTSQHAALARKAANASEHEAGGLVFCNDTDEEGNTLLAFTRAGEGSDSRTMPVLHVRRAVLDEAVKQATGRTLTELQKTIDESLEPQSAPLAGWRIRGRTAIERVQAEGRNILGLLPGRGRAADDAGPAIEPRETVILGAHYDHLGYGGMGSAAPGVTAVHHGADDNASGTALLVEVARRLAAGPPLPRSVLFAAFSGEERGLLGSGHYTANPAVPLSDTVAMVNLDMVGRLDGNKVIVHGTGTGTGFEALVDRLVAAQGLEAAKEPGGFGPSDHASFYAKKIPVLHVFTGSHADYHRPTDTAEKINYDGLARLADLVTDLVRELATAPERPAYIEVASPQFARGGDRPYFGSIPDFGKPGGGYAISGVAKDSPAARGGLAGGDRIVRLGESAITNLEDFDSALRKHKGGDTVPVVVVRDGAEVTLQVTLDAPR